jgi:quercetin dioxygenase-like cupin family protein
MFNIEEAIKSIHEPWKPLEFCRFNGQIARVIMAEGEFKIHDHPFDECIIVYRGHITLWTDQGTLELSEGQGYVAKKGTKHNPMATTRSYLISIIPSID